MGVIRPERVLFAIPVRFMIQRALPILAIAGIALLAWTGLVAIGQRMPMQGMSMDIISLSVMWAVMMLAMMAPAIAPSYLLYSRMSQHPVASFAYLTGYLSMWCMAGIVYAVAHWILQQAELLSIDLRIINRSFAGACLIAAGLWQWSPTKARCVARCRSPLGFMMTDWRDGVGGAFVMGGHYATWCVGCCWLLMVVLFVVGAMSIVWAAVISAYILAERLFPLGRTFDRIVGATLTVCGVWALAH